MVRLLAFMLGSVLGALAQLQQTQLWPVQAYAMLASAAWLLLGLAWRLRVRDNVQALLWALVGALSIFAFTGWRALHHQGSGLDPALEGRDLLLEGWVAEMPRRGEAGWQFEFVPERAWLAGQEVQLPPRLRLSWADRPSRGARAVSEPLALGPDALPANGLRVGQRWRLVARLKRPHGLSNPHGFDAELWMWEQGLQATGYVRQGRGVDAPVWLQDTGRYPVQQARQWIRDRVIDRVSSPEAAGVLAALATGDQGAIPRALWDTFRVTGVTHLVVVSGMHITMFAWLAVAGVGWVWRLAGRARPALLETLPLPVAAAMGGLLLGWGYAVFSGWGVPAQRAIGMLTAVVLLQLSGRRWPWPLMWLAVMTVVVWLDPWALLRAGFWLSFVAVAVLFAAGSPLPETGQRWRGQVWRLIRTQGWVTVALAPLTLLWFGEFSMAGWLANLVAIPWVTLVVTPLALAGIVLAPLWQIGAWAVEGLVGVLGVMAAWPWAAVSRPAVPGVLALIAVLGGVILVSGLPFAWRVWGMLLLWPALAYTPPRPPPGHFEWIAADVGQGTAVIVRTHRHTLVYDTGPPMGPQADAAQRVLLPLLRRHGDAPDAVVVSHADSDHAGGMGTLAKAYPRTAWWTSFDTSERWGMDSRRCEAPMGWEWDGVPFRFLHPWPEDDPRRLSSNAMSCVLLVGEGDASLLLTGDITVSEETRLALAHPELRTRVLLAAHHGSKTSTGPVWLNTLRPEWVVIQSGYRNPYGHPAAEVIRRLDARGIRWVASPDCGAAMGSSLWPVEVRCHRHAVRRYWHHPK